MLMYSYDSDAVGNIGPGQSCPEQRQNRSMFFVRPAYIIKTLDGQTDNESITIHNHFRRGSSPKRNKRRTHCNRIVHHS